ncbi:universal stress protein [Thalassoroseus pseudoceratinae]|uniref:universal stress protein n=1 Tax=Thalassoroseus pseudoceratinae TaxID=2713176 RepID=UPI0014224E48|nr:universal stress protein [Thalassoroseus pseudoceratinae]
MKILLAIDGSHCSETAINEVCSRPWPPNTEVEVFTVIHATVPAVYDPFFVGFAIHAELLEEERKIAPQRADAAAKQIREARSDLTVSIKILEGSPKVLIVEEAERWGADLVLIGSHGYGPAKRFLLGSVSHAVVLHAPCSVEVVRNRLTQAATENTER